MRVRLPYKGLREYVHSTSILDYLHVSGTDICNQTAHVKSLSFRKLIKGDFDLLPLSECSRSELAGEVTLLDQSGTEHGFGLLDTGNIHQNRIEFNETKIAESAESNGSMISCRKLVGFTFPEIMVSLAKQYHQINLPSQNQKWIFAKLDAQGPLPDNFDECEVAFLNAIGNRYSRNKVSFDGKTYGIMQFALL